VNGKGRGTRIPRPSLDSTTLAQPWQKEQVGNYPTKGVPVTTIQQSGTRRRGRPRVVGDPGRCAFWTPSCAGEIALYQTLGGRRSYLCAWHGSVYERVAS
jgi:hypothetical protein